VRSEEGSRPDAEVEFFAAGPGGGGDYPFAGFEPELKHSVFLTGFHGDAIWDRQVEPSPQLVRKDDSGCGLAEFRLRVGFCHVPVAFIGATRAADIWRISNSAPLAAYSVGGSYDRPICRRLLEQAGVPRELFGMAKKAAAVGFVWNPALLHGSSRTAFMRFVRRQGMLASYVGDRAIFHLSGPAGRLLRNAVRADEKLLGGRIGIGRMRHVHALKLWFERFHMGTSRYGNLLFLWSISRMKDNYKDALRERHISRASQTNVHTAPAINSSE
jgi:hypothetical protein